MRTRTTKKGRYTRSFVIKEEIWLEFKKIAEDNGYQLSRKVEMMIKDFISDYKKNNKE
jgi:hypothetical protein